MYFATTFEIVHQPCPSASVDNAGFDLDWSVEYKSFLIITYQLWQNWIPSPAELNDVGVFLVGLFSLPYIVFSIDLFSGRLNLYIITF